MDEEVILQLRAKISMMTAATVELRLRMRNLTIEEASCSEVWSPVARYSSGTIGRIT